MKNVKLVVVSMLVSVLAGCAAKSHQEVSAEAYNKELIAKSAAADLVIDEAPDWFLKPPKNNVSGVYGVGTASSKDMQRALQKAKLQAYYNLAETYTSEMSGNERSYTSETGGTEGVIQNNDQIIIDKFVSAVDISGAELVETKMIRERNDGYRAYVLALYPVGKDNLIKAEIDRRKTLEVSESAASQAQKDLLLRVEKEKSHEIVSAQADRDLKVRLAEAEAFKARSDADKAVAEAETAKAFSSGGAVTPQ